MLKCLSFGFHEKEIVPLFISLINLTLMVSIGHTAKMASLKPANRPAVNDFNVLWLFQNSGAVASNNLCASAFDVNLELSLTQVYVGLCQFFKA